MIKLPHKFTPRGYQRGLFVAGQRGYKRFISVWHRRAGKDKTWLNFLITKAFERVGSYYYILPIYKQAKKIIWEGMDRNGFKFLNHIPEELIVRKNEADLLVELVNGSIIQLLGSDNIDSIVGTNPIGVVFSEYSLQDKKAWDFYRPILRENGGWAGFNFTPRGDNHAKELYDAAMQDPDTWYVSHLSVNDTRQDAPGEDGGPVVTPEDIQRDINEGMDPELAQQEYYCSFNGVRMGDYYGRLLLAAREAGRICDVPWNPALPVHTAWDLGINDAMPIIFFQRDGSYTNLIDYSETRGEGIAYLIGQIKQKSYVYGTHIAPHDIQVKDVVSGKTRLEAAAALGLNFDALDKIPLMDGIDSVRATFPLLRFDKTKCDRLIRCIKNYHKEYDEKKRRFNDKPVHDWSSHGADALRYLCQGLGLVGEQNMGPISSSGLDENPYASAMDNDSPFA